MFLYVKITFRFYNISVQDSLMKKSQACQPSQLSFQNIHSKILKKKVTLLSSFFFLCSAALVRETLYHKFDTSNKNTLQIYTVYILRYIILFTFVCITLKWNLCILPMIKRHRCHAYQLYQNHLLKLHTEVHIHMG